MMSIHATDMAIGRNDYCPENKSSKIHTGLVDIASLPLLSYIKGSFLLNMTWKNGTQTYQAVRVWDLFKNAWEMSPLSYRLVNAFSIEIMHDLLSSFVFLQR